MRDIATLLEALPYIREFHGSTVVIKYGGSAMDDPELREEFARDVVLLKYVGMNPVVVHGGGPDITAYMERLGMPVEFVGGLRVSDEATVEIAKMVLVGKLNTDIVLRIGRHGQPAVGLSGDDGGLLLCSRRSAPGGEDIGFVGQIDRVDPGVINHIARDYIPVVASVGADPQHDVGVELADEDHLCDLDRRLVGKLNTDIVLRIGRHGQPAVGLSGDDGGLLLCSRRSAPGGEDIGFVGQIDRVDPGVINHIARDYIPVVASVGADREGNSYNVNADEAAAAIAVALNARTAIFLTDVRGWLEDPSDPESLIAQASVERVWGALATIEGGMRPKLQACVDAVRGGVGAAQIIDGRVRHSLLLELFTDAGIGTKVTR